MKNFWKRSEAWAIALRNKFQTQDIFVRARLTLALLYFITGLIGAAVITYFIYSRVVAIFQGAFILSTTEQVSL